MGQDRRSSQARSGKKAREGGLAKCSRKKGGLAKCSGKKGGLAKRSGKKGGLAKSALARKVV